MNAPFVIESPLAAPAAGTVVGGVRREDRVLNLHGARGGAGDVVEGSTAGVRGVAGQRAVVEEDFGEVLAAPQGAPLAGTGTVGGKGRPRNLHVRPGAHMRHSSGRRTLRPWRADRQGKNEAAASRPIPAPPFGGAPCLGRRRIRCRVSCWYRVHRPAGAVPVRVRRRRAPARPYVRPTPSLRFTAAGSMAPASVTTRVTRPSGVLSKSR